MLTKRLIMEDDELQRLIEESNSTDEIAELFEKLSENGKNNIKNKIYKDLEKGIIVFRKSQIKQFHFDQYKFIRENQRIWREGFEEAKFLYQLIIGAEEINSKIVKSIPVEEYKKKEFQYLSIKALYARGLQQFLEVLTLAENGFPDGAGARTRSLYEIMIIASFISNQKNSEDVAKAFFQQSNDKKKPIYSWAKKANCFLGVPQERLISFDDITKNSSIPVKHFEISSRYKVNNSLVHAYPDSTFGRIGGRGTKQFGDCPIGRSHFGISDPVSEASIWLVEISMYFFNIFREFDDGLNLLRIRIWGDKIVKIFKKVAEENNL